MAFSKGALTEEFRKRRRGLTLGTHFPLLDEYVHPLSDARLVIAKIEHKPLPVQGCYVVGWVTPDSETIWFYQNFEIQRKARAFFDSCKKSGPPIHSDFKEDLQVNEVYDWEDNFRFSSRTLNIDEMKSITKKLADIFNMAAPDVSLETRTKHKHYAEAVLDQNKIRMYRPHLSMLLHEFAHLVNDQVNKDKGAWHAAGFMRTYLSILSLFPEIGGRQDLEKLARQSKISVADEKDVPSAVHLKTWLKKNYGTDDPKTIPSLI